MGQSRFWLSTHTQIEDAWARKRELLEEHPDNVYQVRKGKDKGTIVFRLVERLQGKEVGTINESKNPTGYTIKRSKKQRRERGIAQIL